MHKKIEQNTEIKYFIIHRPSLSVLQQNILFSSQTQEIRKIKAIFAGTWINLQDAYVAEKSDTGNWVQIGYTAPGAKTNASSFSSKEFTYTAGDNEKDWQAVNIHDLNDCTIAKGTANPWKLSAVASSSNGNGVMTVTATGDADCLGLTPAFTNLARATAQ